MAKFPRLEAKVDGQVTQVLTRIGVVFDIGAPSEAFMPVEHYGKKMPKLRVGDKVSDLTVVDVDPDAETYEKIILSGEDLVKVTPSPMVRSPVLTLREESPNLTPTLSPAPPPLLPTSPLLLAGEMSTLLPTSPLLSAGASSLWARLDGSPEAGGSEGGGPTAWQAAPATAKSPAAAGEGLQDRPKGSGQKGPRGDAAGPAVSARAKAKGVESFFAAAASPPLSSPVPQSPRSPPRTVSPQRGETTPLQPQRRARAVPVERRRAPAAATSVDAVDEATVLELRRSILAKARSIGITVPQLEVVLRSLDSLRDPTAYEFSQAPRGSKAMQTSQRPAAPAATAVTEDGVNGGGGAAGGSSKGGGVVRSGGGRDRTPARARSASPSAGLGSPRSASPPPSRHSVARSEALGASPLRPPTGATAAAGGRGGSGGGGPGREPAAAAGAFASKRDVRSGSGNGGPPANAPGGGGYLDAIQNPKGRRISEIMQGDEMTGIVTVVVRSRGIWFDVGAVKYGFMPRRLIKGNMPDFRVGDIVEGLRVERVDVMRDCFTLSGEGLEFGEPILLRGGEEYDPRAAPIASRRRNLRFT